MRDHLLHLNPHSDLTLQGQLRELLVDAILGGHIPTGSPLPSGRKLAKQLGVARNTVVLAYQQLVDDGYLIAHERSGYFVNEDILKGQIKPNSKTTARSAHAPDWEQRLKVHPAAQRNVVKPTDWHQYAYPFSTGQFDPSRFPLAEWRECSRRALNMRAVTEWAGDNIDTDDPLLVDQIHTRVLPRRGVLANPDEILITVGAQQALYILARLFLNSTSKLGMGDPGYADARNTFLLKTDNVKPLRIDEQGIVVDEQLHDLDYVYVTPSHHYPTTVTMPLERREKLLQCSAQHGFVVIEDDYEAETNFVGEPTPALKSLDKDERVIYVGSLSKTLAPGLRLGFLVGPKEVIREARALRRLMVRHPAGNNQRALALFLASGYHDSLIRRLSHSLKERWQVLGEALDRYLPETSQPPTFGGTSYWVRGPDALDARLLAATAAKESILIEPGDVYFNQDQPPMNCFRLGFSSITVDKIEPGIKRLAELLHQQLQ